MEEFPLKKILLDSLPVGNPLEKEKKNLRTFWVSQLSMFIKVIVC